MITTILNVVYLKKKKKENQSKRYQITKITHLAKRMNKPFNFEYIFIHTRREIHWIFFYTIKIDCNVSKQPLILKRYEFKNILPIIEHLSTNKNYAVSHQCDPSLNYPRTDYEIRKNITAHSRACNARCTSTLHRWPLLPCEEAGNEKYFPEEMHTRAWRITLDRCQSSTLTFVYLFEGGREGSCRPTRIPRISESVVFSSCRANTPLPVNYNYRRRWTSLDRRLIFEMSSGGGRVRNSGKWAVFSISFWSRELRFPSISLRFRITRVWRGLFFEIFVVIRGE